MTGFVKTDFLYSDGRLSSTDAPRFAVSEQPGHRHDDVFNATVQHSRLVGLWKGPELWDSVLQGHVEVDFFTLNDTGDSKYNQSQPRVRQLFVELRAVDWAVNAGQGWDLFSPLNPTTLNTNGNYWFGVNGGFRRPQIEGETTVHVGPAMDISLACSVNANVGRTETVNGRTVNSGEDSGLPVFEGSLELATAGLPGGKLQTLISGLYGQEDVAGLENGVKQWAVGLSVLAPVLEKVTIKCEAQWGENTDAFLMGGGITADGDPVGAASGWAEVSYQALPELLLSGLFGLEEASCGDSAAQARLRNQLFGLGVRYSPIKVLGLCMEYTHFQTSFKNAPDADANLFWWSIIFNL